MDAETKSHLHETPWVVTVPLILLAIPSAIIGWFTVGPVLFGAYFGDAIVVHSRARRAGSTSGERSGMAAWRWLQHIYVSPAFWLALAVRCDGLVPVSEAPGHSGEDPGEGCRASTPCSRTSTTSTICTSRALRPGAVRSARSCGRRGDQLLIDGVLVNGTARTRWQAGRRHAPAADRLPVHLCVRNDHRADHVARLADLVSLGRVNDD